jgi:hypothetical protein
MNHITGFPSSEGITIIFATRRIQTQLIDDLDSGKAAGTGRFGLDGKSTPALRTATNRARHWDGILRARQARDAARSGRSSAAVDTAKVRECAKGTSSRSRTEAVSRPA